MKTENENVAKGLQGKNLDFSLFMDENYKYISPTKNNHIPLIASSPIENARNFEDVFLGAEPIDTIHTGLPELITNAKGSDSYGPIKYMEYDDKGVQISFLRNKEKEYMLVVNHDIESSQTFKIRNEEGFPMKELRSNQIIYPFLLSKFIMLPGDFLLFEYSKPEPN